MRLGLRLRFIIFIGTILVSSSAVLSILLVRQARIDLAAQLNRESKSFAALATRPIGDAYSLYHDSGTQHIGSQIRVFTELDPAITNVTLVDTDGKQLYSLNQGPGFKIDPSLAADFQPSYLKDSNADTTRIVQPYFDEYSQHPFAIVYDISTASLVSAIRTQTEAIVVVIILGLLLSGLAVYFFTNRFILDPIAYLSRVTGIISRGHYGEAIAVSRRDEIGELGTSVAHMADTLRTDIQKLQEVDRLKNEFIMITSHNLRTPLTIINGNVEMLHEMKLVASARLMVESIADSVKQLGIFSEEMLTIASIEGDHISLPIRQIGVKDVLVGLEDDFQAAAKKHGVELTWKQLDGEVSMLGSPVHLRGALRNLLDNAIKFTPKNGTISFEVRAEGKHVIFIVRDSGIGIAPDEQTKLFTKFHRGTSTLQYDYAGTGIGLYATKLVVDAHQGTIAVDTALGKGTTFTVTLSSA